MEVTIKVSKLVADMLTETQKRWEDDYGQRYSISDVIYELVTHFSME